MPTKRDIFEVLRTIPDPEMPISIVDLGIVERIDVQDNANRSCVAIDILPTFVGCPALDMIREQVTEKVSALDGVDGVQVNFIFDPPWSVDRISDEGRASLREHGVTVPEKGSSLPRPAPTVTLRTPSAVPCPFCDSTSTRQESSFGPTRCRMIYYCDACRNSFEHLKKVGSME